MEDKNLFQSLCEIIRNRYNSQNSTLTRQEVIHLLENYKIYVKSVNDRLFHFGKTIVSHHTVDTYLNMFKKCNYISITNKRGVYTVTDTNKCISETYSLEKLRKEYYTEYLNKNPSTNYKENNNWNPLIEDNEI